jgi:hypothetical protein
MPLFRDHSTTPTIANNKNASEQDGEMANENREKGQKLRIVVQNRGVEQS